MKQRYVYRTCPCGPIKGIGTDTLHRYKGIRYAAAGRWEAPVEVTGWEGTYDATAQGDLCCQWGAYVKERAAVAQFYYDEAVEKPVYTYSEDCLNLNIWTPAVGEQLPVLVYIHGGSYETGGGANPNFSGAEYCARGIVFVTINYRLNAFASAQGDGITGNFGLLDQVCALHWIRRNIAAFGGDPDKVTIMGESAGAMSVQHLIYTPLAAGLFRGAILLSGGGILPSAFRVKAPDDISALWQQIKAELNASTMDDLKATDPGTLVCTWKRISLSNPRFAWPATPVIDGITIPDDPDTLAREGRVNGVPTICGVLSEDMWPLTLYRTVLDWGERMEQAGLAPVYGFYMDRAVPGSDHGMYHGGDLRYVFGTMDASWRPYGDIDFRISHDIIEYFTAFVKTGVPAAEGLAEWKPLCGGNRQFLHFGDEPCAMCTVPEERLDAFQKLGKPFPGM